MKLRIVLEVEVTVEDYFTTWKDRNPSVIPDNTRLRNFVETEIHNRMGDPLTECIVKEITEI